MIQTSNEIGHAFILSELSKMPGSCLLQLWTFLLLIQTVHPSDLNNGLCQTLDGKWYNQLGSEMNLNHTAAGQLFGTYRTAVERHQGAARFPHSKVIGASPYNKPGAAVGFAVMFNNGDSITSWTGQCLVCDGEEILVSSWLLREQVYTCIDKWKSTRIGQDMFTRTEQLPDPNEGVEHSSGEIPNHVDPRSRSLSKRSTFEIPCKLDGNWYNELGSEVILHQHPDNSISGEYRTAVERSSGAAGNSHSLVYGLGNAYSMETTFAMFVVWNNGSSVTGWVGQCHICGKTKEEILHVNWLLRSQIDGCDDNWKATSYGQNSFTRHEQRNGPRKHLGIHTPQQEGEAVILEVKENFILPCGGSTSTYHCISGIFPLFLILLGHLVL